jgi:hypothetical protein
VVLYQDAAQRSRAMKAKSRNALLRLDGAPRLLTKFVASFWPSTPPGAPQPGMQCLLLVDQVQEALDHWRPRQPR